MYAVTFTNLQRELDAEFHRLDEEIAASVRAMPGYLGEERWENRSNGLTSTVYYWTSLEALQPLMQHPTHRLARQQQAKWLDGYHVVVSQVLRMYGDGRLQDRLPVTHME